VALAALSAVEMRRRRQAKGTSMADAKLRIRRLFEEPWKGNWDVLDEIVAPGYVGWDSGRPEPIRGLESLREHLRAYGDAFPDARVTVHDQVAEGGKVATRWSGRGTNAGEIAEIAATGKEVTVSGLTISTLENGKVVEQWTTWDRLGMLVQLGAIPAATEA
jgi:predicted ester cyclase